MNTQRDLQQQKETVETVKRQDEALVKINKLPIRTGIRAGKRQHTGNNNGKGSGIGG